MSFSYMLESFRCTAGLPRDTKVRTIRLRRFERLELREQEGPELCWAAAIQAVLAYHRRRVSQELILDSVRGASRTKGLGAATLREVIAGISGPWTSWHVNNGNATALVADLSNRNPVIIGLRRDGGDRGHIVVAYGAAYVSDYFSGRTYIDRVRVWDPWPGEAHKWMSGCDAEDEIQFALHSWGPR